MALLINAYCTLRNPPPLAFPHRLNSRRDRTDPELVAHLQGFVGFMLREQPEMTKTLYATMRHIQRVQHHLSFELEPSALDELAHWAWRANAILFMRDGTLLNPSGEELLDSAGRPGEAQLPYPEDAFGRRERSLKKLAELGIQTPESLPPVVGEDEVTFRSPHDVVSRALALLVVAVRAESLAQNDPLPVAELQQKLPAAFDALSPVERAFLNAEAPEQQAIVDHVWRYEALFVLEWALGMFDQIPLPTRICDVPAVARAIFDRNRAELSERAKLRPAAHILAALDLSFRLHWAVRQAMHITNTDPPAGLDPGVLQERRHALHWLVRFEDAEWDDVDTPT
jgi:hypothetical protein